MTSAKQVTNKFRKDVEKVSKDKVRGYMVHHFRTLFSPVEMVVVRSRDLSITESSPPKRKRAPRKRPKKQKKSK